MKTDKKQYRVKGIGAAAVFLILIGAIALFNNNLTPNDTANNPNTPGVIEGNGVHIPAVKLPEKNMSADMIGLIVYNGEIYTQTMTEIDTKTAKNIIGEKLGTTKGTIDEWSEQEAYDEEFASTVEIADVYTVKGYDNDFRIMTYGTRDGKPYAEFYENLNGITLKSGEDVFGKLNMTSNITSAKHRTFNDWLHNADNYHSVTDMKTVNTFVQELNNTKPLLRKENSDPIRDSQNNEDYKELTIQLNDGTNVRLTLLKEGYIYYGSMGAYFKMDKDVFSKMWNALE